MAVQIWVLAAVSEVSKKALILPPLFAIQGKLLRFIFSFVDVG